MAGVIVGTLIIIVAVITLLSKRRRAGCFRQRSVPYTAVVGSDWDSDDDGARGGAVLSHQVVENPVWAHTQVDDEPAVGRTVRTNDVSINAVSSESRTDDSDDEDMLL